MTSSGDVPKGQGLAERAKAFAVRSCRFVRTLPSAIPEQAMARQLVRAATSVGENYSAARRSRSGREFVARMGVVVEEADETVYWLEVLQGSSLPRNPETQALLQEARELRAIFAASLKTAKATVARQNAGPRR
jgi:four helix bundle protein